MDNLKRLEKTLKNNFNKSLYKQYASICHPDLYHSEEEKNLANILFKQLQELMLDKPIAVLKNKYNVRKKIAEGSISDVYAVIEKTVKNSCYLKVSINDRYNNLIKHEIETLKFLQDKSNKNVYSRLIPKVLDTVHVNKNIGFIYEIENPILPLSHWTHLDGRHIAWIYKRLLSILGFAHIYDIIHGSITPDHILINYKTHGIILIDWCFSGKSGYKPTKIPNKIGRPNDAKYNSSTDIYMATTSLLHDELPAPMQSFFKSCLVNQNRRPNCAWTLLDEFTDFLKKLYGKPKFVELKP